MPWIDPFPIESTGWAFRRGVFELFKGCSAGRAGWSDSLGAWGPSSSGAGTSSPLPIPLDGQPADQERLTA